MAPAAHPSRLHHQPRHRHRSWSASLVLLLVAGSVATACSRSGDGDEATTVATLGHELASATDTDSDATDDAGGDDEPIVRIYEPDPDALAFTVDSTTSTTASTTSTAGGGSSATTAPRPSGGGGSPVTTIGGGGGADPSGVYKGVVGSLALDELVATAVVAPPTAAPGTHPLTGLPGQPSSRPAAVVKIDNSSAARPQAGLDVADIVVEEEVEGGLTRFAAVFHSTSAIVGPVRSGRTTDIGVINGFGRPLLLYSGANGVTDTLLLRQTNVQNRSASRSSGYWRQSGRRAPSNLYSDTGPHWASASGGPPPAQFAYRSPGEAAGGTPDGDLTVSYRANTASWSWDGTAWLRSQGGKAHTASSGNRISAANVVVVEARKVDTGMVDSSGATVPEFVFVGSGKATVFTGGNRIEGSWTRPTLGSVATLTTGDGSVIELTPGRTWIELIQAGAGMLR